MSQGLGTKCLKRYCCVQKYASIPLNRPNRKEINMNLIFNEFFIKIDKHVNSIISIRINMKRGVKSILSLFLKFNRTTLWVSKTLKKFLLVGKSLIVK